MFQLTTQNINAKVANYDLIVRENVTPSISAVSRSETPLNQALEGVKFMAIVNASDIFGKFFEVKFFILENVIPQMPMSVIYQTHASFF